MTWREMYSDPDNVNPSHTYKWAANRAKDGWHCETPELAALDGDWRLVWRSGRPMVVCYDSDGFATETMEPSTAEIISERWRLWTDHGRLLRQ